MKEKPDVLQGTLALMVLKTLDVLGAQHGWGIARRIEQISGDLLAVNQGTLYPLLLKLEHEGSIASELGTSENNRRARFYRLTAAGRKQLQAETRRCSLKEQLVHQPSRDEPGIERRHVPEVVVADIERKVAQRLQPNGQETPAEAHAVVGGVLLGS